MLLDMYSQTHNSSYLYLLFTFKSLGRWVRTQRSARRGKGTNRISAEQIKKLDAIGFQWSVVPRSSKPSSSFDFTVRAKPGPLGIRIKKTSDLKKTFVEGVNTDSQLFGRVQEGDYLESVRWKVTVNCNHAKWEEIVEVLGKKGDRVLGFSRLTTKSRNSVKITLAIFYAKSKTLEFERPGFLKCT